MSATPITDELRALLGPDVVLLRCGKGSKKPIGQWRDITAANMTPAYLAVLEHGNIGVALGRVSGNLIVVDVDVDSLIPAFLAVNPEWEDTLQTHGARGRSFWLQMRGDYPAVALKLKTRTGKEAGEWRAGTNCQSIIHGIHPNTGKPYEFVKLAKPLVADFASIKWPEEIANPPALQRDRATDVISVSLSAPSALSTLSLCLSVKSLAQAVEISLPAQEHHNNAALFKLARAIKAIETDNGPLTLPQKKEAFAHWYDQAHARGVLREGQSRDDYLAEFLNACKRAKIPLGSSPAEQAWALAATEPLPAEAAAFETQNAKLLVACCYQLDRLSETEPWFLSYGTAAQLLGTTRPTAGKLLTAMVELGIIQVVQVNTSTKATRYRYLRSDG